MNDAFQYQIDTHGADAEDDYQYTAKDGNCTSSGKVKYFPYTHFNVTAPTLDGLCDAVASGPVSVAVHVNEKFQRYEKGIFRDENCTDVVNHGVIITGCQILQKEPEEELFITLRNSWGA